MLRFVPKPQETRLNQVRDTLPNSIDIRAEKYNYSTGETDIEAWKLPLTVEEAQRLGRILRPKSDGHTASFYTLVSLQTCEEDFARHRQLFLTEQVTIIA